MGTIIGKKSAVAAAGLLMLLTPGLAVAESVPSVTGGGTLANGDRLNVNAVLHSNDEVTGTIKYVTAAGERRVGRVSCVAVVDGRAYVEAIDRDGQVLAVVVEDGGRADKAGAVPAPANVTTCETAPLLGGAASHAVTRGNFTVR